MSSDAQEEIPGRPQPSESEDSGGAETVREPGSLKVEADVWECLRSHLGWYLKSAVLRTLGSPNIQGPGQNSGGMSRR